MKTARPHLLPLTSIRFLAALWVVVYHQAIGPGLLNRELDATPKFLQNLVEVGFLGVNLFFVLSGFILTYTYFGPAEKGELRKRDFLIARLARIGPLYYIAFVASIPFVVVAALLEGGPISAWKNLAAAALTNLTFTQTWIPSLALSWNPPGWSLSDEVFFYLIFPVVLSKMCRFNRTQCIGVALCCLLIALLPAVVVWKLGIDLTHNFWGYQPDESLIGVVRTIKHNPLIRAPEFLFGVCLGVLYCQDPDVPRIFKRVYGKIQVAVCVLVVVLVCGFYGKSISYPLLHNGLLTPFFGLFILALACQSFWFYGVLSHPVLVRLGEASYGMYILHIPLIWYINWLDWATVQWRLSHPVLLFLVYLGLVIGLSWVAFVYIEEPARIELRKRLTARLTGTPQLIAEKQPVTS